MDPVSSFTGVTYLKEDTQFSVSNFIAQLDTGYYDLKLFNSASLDIVDLGTTLTSFEVDKSTDRTYYGTSDKLAHYRCTYYQSRTIYTKWWYIMSLDVILGTVGGMSAVIWGILGLVFSGYESFKLDVSMISSVYPTSPPQDDLTTHSDDTLNGF